MRKFLFKLTVFVLLLILVDHLLDYSLQGYQPKNYKLFIKSKEDYFKKTYNSNILVLGDSHIADAIDPQQVEDVLGKSMYNLAVYHSSPVETFYYLKYILKKTDSIPEVIVLGTNPIMFSRPLKSGKYTPLLISDIIIKFELYNSTEFSYGLISKFAQEKYLINVLFTKREDQESMPIRRVNRVYNGYNGNTSKLFKIDSSRFNFSNNLQISRQIYYFKKCIELAKNNGIEVIIANPPILNSYLSKYQKQKVFTSFDKVIQSIASSYNLLVFNRDYNQFNNLEIDSYYDIEHLNSKGAKIYSLELADWLIENSI